MLSSSPPHPSSTLGTRKPKKPPPITPKRFTRFFTPRSSVHGSSHPNSLRRSGRQLQDITQAAINRRPNAFRKTPPKTVNFADIMPNPQPETPKVNSRKRKTPYLSPDSSPALPSPSKRSRLAAPPPINILEDPVVHPAPIKCIRSLGSSARILQRSFGGLAAIGRGFHRDHCTSWQEQTADFYSGSDDFHQLSQGAPPFCTASCNTNGLVAVGDEDGWVHLLDTDESTSSDFTKAHISFQAHKNAVMDVQFSSDDTLLATASGDQTAQIIDARTQQCVHVLARHASSVKQVRFQPGDDKIVATSSRDGTVQIWDLRCSSGAHPVHSVWGENAPYASTIRTLAAAHADSAFIGSNGPSIMASKSVKEPMGKSEAFSRRGDISVTALSFLPPGREHLLLTASDASTCVKLWDIRGRYSRRGPALPISTTRQPESHNRHRHFAINSLTLSGDGSRLYALSKDNTIYAYAASHLVLGHAPELAVTDSSRAKHVANGKEGVGPIYGFRHRNFHAGSFYVKTSLRKASGDRPELLAVGSTDGCPVLFPTDENLLKREKRRGDDEADDLPEARPLKSPFLASQRSLSRKSSRSGFSSLLTDTIPIYEQGTPLIRGHDAEVTSVTWTKDGALVSVADDFSVRCWREGGEARALRLSGEGEGRRWMCGWAAVENGFDDDE
ncbi:WD repeat-containing protein-like protein [Lindgomyces ingoldianus]|uniref:WD repeat-containing protein-like protein n=1 Tax=Lindgomyces ingoldianus TaxID=673940 RepID=A0ACB6QPU3_9PLEO|nr:WD repeat-containing protein-like protein [Lindgomyces ingoldianus]KAF2468900.1 WD repeat-containing protein-like protein [Lindgomyces ingoldianus]